ncbi:MAG TPA: methyltransferase [Solirubrobacteraceae bacterium]
MPAEPPTVALRRLVNGYQVTQAIHVAAALGIADLLTDGARSADDLAAAVGAHAPSLCRVLRALAAVGVLHEGDDGRFSLTAIGQCLRSDAPDPVGGWAAFAGRPSHFAAWSNLLHAVRTGENAFRSVHGTDVWEYRAAHPEEGAIFDRAMTDVTRRANRHLLEAYDFGRFASVVDVGGGHGELLAALLSAHPRMRGVLFDLPHVVAGATAEAGRCEVVAGSFFDDPIPAGADAYVLKAILHDWGDEEAMRILRSCHSAAPEHAALLVIDRDLGAPNENADAKLSDLNMMVGPGGRERTRGEFAALFTAGGFTLERVVPTAIGLSVFEGRPAEA